MSSFLVFSLCDEEYAVPLLKIKEVLALGDITPVPYTAPHFKGIMNLVDCKHILVVLLKSLFDFLFVVNWA